MDFEITYVEDSPTTATGKHRLVVSSLDPAASKKGVAEDFGRGSLW
jgi:hypothetical protein